MATLYLPSQSTSTSVPPQTHQQHHLESYGVHCSFGPCHQIDFLPLSCASCHLPFCTSHFSPSSHSCSSPPPANSIDRRVPSCPLCGAACPTSSSSSSESEDANEAVERHLMSGRCAKLDVGGDGLFKEGGAVKVKRPGGGGGGGCGRKGCKDKVLPGTGFRCSNCAREHCARHRMPEDHSCPSIPAPASTSITTKPKTKPKPMAALKAEDKGKEEQTVKGKGKGKEAGVGVVKSLVTGLKEDKRARQEEESRRRALKARQAKGLLTEAEKMELATKAAIEVRSGGGKVGKAGKAKGQKGKDCIIS